MDTQRFDHIARLFAARRTRRAALAGGFGLAATAFAPLSDRVLAQDATPTGTADVMTSTDPHPSADAPAEPEYLFVQSFAGGTWGPKTGEEGVYTLTLSGAAANTVYFSDRPERIFGLWSTQEFLDELGFTPANPPNAALVAQRAEAEDQDVLVIELLSPTYDADMGSLSYDARVLADYGEPGLAHAARQQADHTLPETFGEGGLFIDGLNFDCTDGSATCYQTVNGTQRDIGRIDNVGYCGSGFGLHGGSCAPCNGTTNSAYYGQLCAEAYPTQCSYTCAGGGCSWDCYVHDFTHSAT